MLVSDDAEKEQSMKTLTNSGTIPTVRGRGGRVRMWRRRRRCVKWCAARIKAKEIDDMDWKKLSLAPSSSSGLSMLSISVILFATHIEIKVFFIIAGTLVVITV